MGEGGSYPNSNFSRNFSLFVFGNFSVSAVGGGRGGTVGQLRGSGPNKGVYIASFLHAKILYVKKKKDKKGLSIGRLYSQKGPVLELKLKEMKCFS